MAEPHVVTALVAKRAELSGELGRIDERRGAIKAHIANLDAVLRLFRYAGDPTKINPMQPVDLVIVFRPSDQAGRFVTEAAARPERPAIWLQTGIRADEEIAAARADGLLAVQDLCSFRVHLALFP